MFKAGRQCTDLQSLRHRRGFVPPCGDLGNPDRRYQKLLQRGQRRIGANLSVGVSAVIATGQSNSGDGDNKKS